MKYIPVKVIQVLEGDNNTTDYHLIQPARLQPSAKLSDAGIEGEESRVIMQGIVVPFPVCQMPLIVLYEKLRSADGWLYIIVKKKMDRI